VSYHIERNVDIAKKVAPFEWNGTVGRLRSVGNESWLLLSTAPISKLTKLTKLTIRNKNILYALGRVVFSTTRA